MLKKSGTDNTGMINIDDKGMYELRYNDLLAPMVKAIQELKAEKDNEIAKLQTENDELSAGLLAEKSNNEKLEERLAKYEEMQNMLAGEIEKLKSNNSDLKEVKLTEKK